MNRVSLLSFLLFTTLLSSAHAVDTIATVPEIPYYIRQLEQSTVETKTMELNKIIHDAVVNADLSDKKVVKELEPMIQRLQVAIDSGLDRPYLEDRSSWIQSAIDYYNREKLRKTIDIPQADWLPPQTTTAGGLQLSTFPDKIILLDGKKSKTIAESSNIYEAVISPDGRMVAFFRRTDENSNAEVWSLTLRNLKRKKIATLPSCATLVFSLDGGRLFFQEKTKSNTDEAVIWTAGASGGGLKQIGKARALETVVAKGKYAGALIVFQKKIHHLGTTQEDCAHAWEASGKEIGRLKQGPCR